MAVRFLDRFSPYLLLVMTTLFWGGNFNVARAVSGEVPPLGLSFWRWMVAWMILFPLAYPSMWRQRHLLIKHWFILLLLAVSGVTLFNSLVYLGLQTTTAVNASLMQSVNPVFIILLSMLLLGHGPRARQWLGMLVSMAGAVVILTHGDIGVLREFNFTSGDLLVLLAVFLWGVYTVLLRKVPVELRGMPLMGYTVTLGTILILPFYLHETLSGRPLPVTPASVASILYVAIFPSVLAYFFWNHATERIGPERTGQFSHLIPVFGILIATLVLGEALQAYHLAGILLVSAGLLLANFRTPVSRVSGKAKQMD
ncbi:MAG: DMT family transporter [Chromatiales bacterium]|jgi:drug/metabolite transporter (DMT)-like permease